MAASSQLQRDLFAEYVAEGMHPTDAYEKAGFVRNRSSASRMTKRPDVAARIAELRAERRAVRQANLPAPMEMPAPVPAVPTCENPKTVAEMGITKAWVAAQYIAIAAEAKELGQFSAANSALKELERMRAAEDEKNGPEAAPDKPRVDIDALGNLLDKVGGLIALGKNPEQYMKDVTPTADAVTHQELRAHRAAESET